MTARVRRGSHGSLQYDFVIAGGGSAGGALADRLSVDPGRKGLSAPVMTIAEKAADLILGKEPLPPSRAEHHRHRDPR